MRQKDQYFTGLTDPVSIIETQIKFSVPTRLQMKTPEELLCPVTVLEFCDSVSQLWMEVGLGGQELWESNVKNTRKCSRENLI